MIQQDEIQRAFGRHCNIVEYRAAVKKAEMLRRKDPSLGSSTVDGVNFYVWLAVKEILGHEVEGRAPSTPRRMQPLRSGESGFQHRKKVRRFANA